MKVIRLTHGWSSDYVDAEIKRGNVVVIDNDYWHYPSDRAPFCVPGSKQVCGAEEHIRVIKQVGGWRHPNKKDNWQPSKYLLPTTQIVDQVISIIRIAFPEAQAEVVDHQALYEDGEAYSKAIGVLFDWNE